MLQPIILYENLDFENTIAKKNNFITSTFNKEQYFNKSEDLKLNIIGKGKNTTVLESVPYRGIIYRGSYLKCNDYQTLYDELEYKGYRLINTSSDYNFIHEYICAYEFIRDTLIYLYNSTGVYGYMPEQICIENMSEVNCRRIKNKLGSFTIRCIDEKEEKYMDVTNDILEMSDYIEKLLRRDKVIIKQHINIEYNSIPKYRAVYFNHSLGFVFKIVGNRIIENSKKYNSLIYRLLADESIPKEILKIADGLNILPSNFYSIDMTLTEDKEVVILDINDGQITDIETERNAIMLYHTLRKM